MQVGLNCFQWYLNVEANCWASKPIQSCAWLHICTICSLPASFSNISLANIAASKIRSTERSPYKYGLFGWLCLRVWVVCSFPNTVIQLCPTPRQSVPPTGHRASNLPARNRSIGAGAVRSRTSRPNIPSSAPISIRLAALPFDDNKPPFVALS